VYLSFKHESYVLFLSYGLETLCFRYFPMYLPAPLSCTFTFASFPRPLSFSYSVYCNFMHRAAPLILRSLRYFYKLLTHRISTVLRRPVYLKRLIQYHYFMWKILSLPDPVPLRAQAVD
jgi:hypothetical protein